MENVQWLNGYTNTTFQIIMYIFYSGVE